MKPKIKSGKSAKRGSSEKVKRSRAATERRRVEIVAIAKNEHEKEGELEIDDNAEISNGRDNGCYVAAWVWVSFVGTRFNKDDHLEYKPMGMVQRGVGNTFVWRKSYQRVGEQGFPTYPLLTRDEARADAKARGKKARFIK